MRLLQCGKIIVFRLIFEFPATGGVLPSSRFYSLKLLRYIEKRDFIILGCEVAFMLLIIYYTLLEFIEMKYLRTIYLKHFWNSIDIIILLVLPISSINI